MAGKAYPFRASTTMRAGAGWVISGRAPALTLPLPGLIRVKGNAREAVRRHAVQFRQKKSVRYAGGGIFRDAAARKAETPSLRISEKESFMPVPLSAPR